MSSPHFSLSRFLMHYCTIFVTVGITGVALKSNALSNCAYAGSFGLMRDGDSHIIFNVVSACCSSRHHREIGQFGSVKSSAVMKCPLIVLIALSTTLCRWMWSGASWYLLYASSMMKSFCASDTSLSRWCSCDFSPRSVMYLYICLYTLMVSSLDQFFNGRAKIALQSHT